MKWFNGQIITEAQARQRSAVIIQGAPQIGSPCQAFIMHENLTGDEHVLRGIYLGFEARSSDRVTHIVAFPIMGTDNLYAVVRGMDCKVESLPDSPASEPAFRGLRKVVDNVNDGKAPSDDLTPN